VGNADIPQCPVIEFHQGSDSLLDFTLVVPMLPSARNGTPRLGEPIAVVRPIGLKRRRVVKCHATGVRDGAQIRPGSIGLVLKFRSVTSGRVEEETIARYRRRSCVKVFSGCSAFASVE